MPNQSLPRSCGDTAGAAPTDRTVALKVVNHPAPRSSKNGTRRAIVLLLVNLLIVAHIVQWLIQGMTLSPVEPSESMYTLEFGRINTGFVLFATALISTFIFGRFFCGWGCHVIAIQDTCTWMLGKIGIRPKQFRSRLLLWAPLLLGMYMFVWATFKREVLFPVLHALKVTPPLWLDKPNPFPGFSTHFMVEDYWATFPPWYIAIPFLLICGFVTVYFLGSKGFCTYGCPYGGLFAPVDKVSIGRIVVSDACEGCGHCTAACTSNVRVHQEVRDFGQVVDPGCMKCLDCVSVCPNDALSFKFSTPAVFAKPRSPQAINHSSVRPKYDLSWPQEVVFFLIGIAVFVAVRGMLDSVPLLLAGGFAGIGVYIAFQLWRLVAWPHARMQNIQLKHAGRVKPTGVVFAVFAVAFFSMVGWSGYVRYHRYLGDLGDAGIEVPFATVFSPGYTPDPVVKARAIEAIGHFEKGGGRGSGGVGWPHQPKTLVRIAWLYAVAGDWPGAERNMREAIERGEPTSDMVFGLARMLMLQNKPAEEGKRAYEEVLAKHPDLHDVRLALAFLELQVGSGDKAIPLAEYVLGPKAKGVTPGQFVRAAATLTDCGRPSDAIRALEGAIKLNPIEPEYHFGLGQLLLVSGDAERGIIALRESLRLDPTNPIRMRRLAESLRDTGQAAEADALAKRAAEREKEMGLAPPAAR